jgi:hypothetical protein
MKNKYRPKYQLGKNNSESTSLGVNYYDPKLIADMDFLRKVKGQPTIGKSKEQDDYTKKVNSIKKKNAVKMLPNAQMNREDILPINPDRTLSGQALPNTRAARNDKFLEHAQGAMDAAGLLMGAGALKPLLSEGLDRIGAKMFRPRFSSAVDDLGYHTIDNKGRQIYQLADNTTPELNSKGQYIGNRNSVDLSNLHTDDYNYINFGEPLKKGQGYAIDAEDYPGMKNWREEGLKDAGKIIGPWLKENEMTSSDRIDKLLNLIRSNKYGGTIKAQVGGYPNISFGNTGIQIPDEIQNDLISEDRWSMIPGFDSFSQRMNPNNPIQKGRTAVGQATTRTPEKEKQEPFNPYFMLRGATTGLSWLANKKSQDRQNQYMYNQYSTLGQMNPANIEDFQPNYYSLYAKFGGQLKKGGLTPNKAREILHDKTAHGHPLTDKQRRFFGAMSKGNTLKY